MIQLGERCPLGAKGEAKIDERALDVLFPRVPTALPCHSPSDHSPIASSHVSPPQLPRPPAPPHRLQHRRQVPLQSPCCCQVPSLRALSPSHPPRQEWLRLSQYVLRSLGGPIHSFIYPIDSILHAIQSVRDSLRQRPARADQAGVSRGTLLACFPQSATVHNM